MATQDKQSSMLLNLTLPVLIITATVTVFFIWKLQPSSAGAFAFAALWLNTPQIGLAVLLSVLKRGGKPLLPWCTVSIALVCAGLFFISDAIFWHPDAQSAIGVMFTPVLQLLAFVVLAPLAWWIASRLSANKD
ncbi:hypothetical protein [Variovorax sp. PCZ-1]|uniref:hypothetical protein n=1 Tax=Variovorax sp. PCZ-1 TaxID=2835533 RepID=UPI001BD058BF|nr:hypothetical protein [Variovorax sp. PCZ-1]MBS7808494.1 hypothetical protein [Variovorax sp. PCZ-1]